MDNKFCKTGILLLVVILNTVLVSAQSFNFLNYNEAQVMYNPAMLSSVSRTQIALNYRNNKLTEGVNYYSTMLGFQMPLGLYTEKLNLGTFCISAFDDRINYAPSVNKTGVALAYSQPVRLSTYSFLSIGMQCNIYQKRLDIGQFTTGNQWSANLGFDPSFTNGEEQFNDKINLYTLN